MLKMIRLQTLLRQGDHSSLIASVLSELRIEASLDVKNDLYKLLAYSAIETDNERLFTQSTQGIVALPGEVSDVDSGLLSSLWKSRWNRDPATVQTRTSSDQSQDIVVEAYPNPANPSTELLFTLDSQASVSIRIVNMLGQNVKTLLLGSLRAGTQSANIDLASIPSGAYIVELTANGRQAGNTMLNVLK